MTLRKWKSQKGEIEKQYRELEDIEEVVEATEE